MGFRFVTDSEFMGTGITIMNFDFSLPFSSTSSPSSTSSSSCSSSSAAAATITTSLSPSYSLSSESLTCSQAVSYCGAVVPFQDCPLPQKITYILFLNPYLCEEEKVSLNRKTNLAVKMVL
jgi:hypothetical protein